ncbi:MAG: WD40 repeat domain-containing serine/threonine protein kinase [Planctomycetota bacterium]
MSEPFNNRDLLYGVLAVQMGYVDRRQLISAIGSRHAGDLESMGDVLLHQQVIDEECKRSLDQLVEDHIALHGNDSAKSLATLGGIGSLENELRTLGFSDVNATLAHLPSTVAATPRGSTAKNDTVGESNRFRVLHTHAKGGIGQVSVAVDKELSREVALKELQARFADDQNTRARFVLEAEVTGGLEHPGVVPVYGLGHYADGRPFYAMRFVRGDSMQDAVARFHQEYADSSQPGFDLELRKLLQRFISVCNAIEYAHSRGVLHRDLKPGNIMMGNYGETLVVDWGLAKVGNEPSHHTAPADESKLYPASVSDSAPTQLGSTVGTPQYMSPEQAAGRVDELRGSSDVYSLGATLYHILTGRPPFEGSDVGVVLAAVQAGIYPSPRSINPRVSKPLEAICSKAMELEPADRYLSARALAEDVERTLADESIEAMPDSGIQRIQRWTRRHRGFTLASAVGLLLVSLISAVSYFAVSSERDEARRQRDRAIASEKEAQESFEAAEKARSLAVEEERRASRIAYNSTLSQASNLLGSDPMTARFLLADEVRCPPSQRDFVWQCLMRQLRRELQTVPLENSRAHVICYSPDGKTLVTGGGYDSNVVLHDAASGKPVATLQTDLLAVDRVVFSADGQTLAIEYEEYLSATDSPTYDVEVQVWDVATRERQSVRKLSLPQSPLLCASDSGFTLHCFVSEMEYSQTQQDYAFRYPLSFDATGQVLNRWWQWSSYDLLTEQTSVRYLAIDQQIDLAEGFHIHGKWLTSPCHTADGEFLWMYDTQTQISKTVRVGDSGDDKSWLMTASDDEAALFFGLKFIDDSVSEIDSLAFLDTVEFDTDLSFHRLSGKGPSHQRPLALGRVRSGVFVESERSQFVATNRNGSVLATAMEPRPFVQVVDLRRDGETYWVPAHLGDVVSVAVSPRGDQIATVGLDRALRLWSVSKLAAQHSRTTPKVERPRRLLLTPDGNQVMLLALGPDPSASGIDYSQPLPPGVTDYPTPVYFQSELIRLSDQASTQTRDYEDPPQFRPSQGKNGLGVFGSFSEGISSAIASSFEASPLQTPDSEIKLSADGSQLMVVGRDRLLQYDLASGEPKELWGPYYPNLVEPQPIRRITVSDDLKYFATMLEEDRSVRLYDVASQKLLREITTDLSNPPVELKFVSNSHTLLVIHDFDSADAEAPSVVELFDADSDDRRTIFLPPLDDFRAPEFSADGRLMIHFQQFDREVLICDLETGDVVSRVNVVRETPGGMLPGSKLLMLFGESGELKLWDIEMNQYRATLQLLDGEMISRAALSRDQQTLIVLGERGSLRFFGADRLRDDFADIYNLINIPVLRDTAAPSPQEPPSSPLNPEDFPTIEVLDEMPTPATPAQPSIEQDDGVPLPPAPVD